MTGEHGRRLGKGHWSDPVPAPRSIIDVPLPTDDIGQLHQLLDDAGAVPPPMRRVLVIEIHATWLGLALVALLALVTIGLWGALR